MANQIDLTQITGSANANVNGQILFANVVSSGQGGQVAADPNFFIANSGGATPITTIQIGSTTSNGYRIVMESNTGTSNDAYVEFVNGSTVTGYVGTQGAGGDLVGGSFAGDLILAAADGTTKNVYIKSVGGNVLVNGNIIMGGGTSATYANQVLVNEGTNGSQIILNSDGADWGCIANPINQVWALGYAAAATNNMPISNVFAWSTGAWCSISSGADKVCQPNANAFGVGAGRATLVLGGPPGGTTTTDAIVALQNGSGYLCGYFFGSNSGVAVLSTGAMNIYANGLPQIIISSPTSTTLNATSTTATAANVNINSSNLVLRVTSSANGKLNITPLTTDYVYKVLQFEPVSFKSNTQVHVHDDPNTVTVGLIAEQVNSIDPTIGGHESVDYRAVGIMLLGVVREQEKRIKALEDRLAKANI